MKNRGEALRKEMEYSCIPSFSEFRLKSHLLYYNYFWEIGESFADQRILFFVSSDFLFLFHGLSGFASGFSHFSQHDYFIPEFISEAVPEVISEERICFSSQILGNIEIKKWGKIPKSATVDTAMQCIKAMRNAESA